MIMSSSLQIVIQINQLISDILGQRRLKSAAVQIEIFNVISYHNMKCLPYTHKVMQCMDLLKLIGSYKHEFERASDIERLNTIKLFQDQF